MSWANGKALGKNEPIAPPFPLADFGVGELGAIACLNALHVRSVKGGSYLTNISLVKFNEWLMSLGTYDDELWKVLSAEHPREGINHLSNFDAVGKAAVESMQRVCPQLWQEAFMHDARAHFGQVKTHAPVVQLEPFKPKAWLTPTRCAGYDKARWTES